ncbi:MAG: AI-2E family transporter [Melioribacteraceae bacterium]|nr:AI-2E family transporter [Melioribacteraceae bacterium]
MKRINTESVSSFFITIIGLVVTFIVLKELQHIFIPFVIAILLYFIFDPLNTFLKKYKVPGGLTVVADILIISGIIWGFARIIINSLNEFESALPVYGEKLNNMIKTTLDSIGISRTDLADFDLMKLVSEINIGGIAGGFFSSTLTIVSTIFFVLLFFIFISSGYNNIYEVIKRHYVSKNIKIALHRFKRNIKKSDKTLSQSVVDSEKSKLEVIVHNTFRDINEQVQKYIVTKTLISLLTAIVVGIILFFFDLDFLVVWIFFTFLFNFIPNIGSILAVLFPALIALVQFESIGYSVLIAGILAGTQNIIGNFIEPKIMGNRLGLNPLVILLSLLLWGYIWGIVGMFLSVPLTAVIKIILSNSHKRNMKFLSELMGN